MKPWATILILAACTVLACCVSAAAQAKPRQKRSEFPAPPATARAWHSQTTGKEYNVWIANRRLYAVWTNVPADLAKGGAYIRTECRRVGTRWVGSSQTYLPFPCGKDKDGKQIGRWCHLLTKIEFKRVESDRIAGSAEGYLKFDCEKCAIAESVMKDFEWTPKGQ
ncbi:MAG: hypothetical protein ACE145_11245 [Terriglobia bacterium]